MSKQAQHVIVIGGSSGIGLSTARRLAGQGFRVTIASRSQEKLEAAAHAIGGDVHTRRFDAAGGPEKAAAFFAGIGPFEHLVLAMSGGKGLGPFAKLDLDDVRAGFDEKTWPHFTCAQAALSYLGDRGSITFVSAVSAQMPVPGIAGIAMVNGALLTAVPILAVELKPIRVNAVTPGVIDTPWWSFLPDDQRQAVFAEYAGKTPVGRIGKPDDVARAIELLVTNGFITGEIIAVDGGLRLAAGSS